MVEVVFPHVHFGRIEHAVADVVLGDGVSSVTPSWRSMPAALPSIA
jgi:hypothetical protein